MGDVVDTLCQSVGAITCVRPSTDLAFHVKPVRVSVTPQPCALPAYPSVERGGIALAVLDSDAATWQNKLRLESLIYLHSKKLSTRNY